MPVRLSAAPADSSQTKSARPTQFRGPQSLSRVEPFKFLLFPSCDSPNRQWVTELALLAANCLAINDQLQLNRHFLKTLCGVAAKVFAFVLNWQS